MKCIMINLFWRFSFLLSVMGHAFQPLSEFASPVKISKTSWIRTKMYFVITELGKIQETNGLLHQRTGFQGFDYLLPYGCPAKMASIIEFSRFVPVKKNKKLRRN